MAIEVTDETVRAAQRGDPRAQEQLYRALAPGVLGYFTARGASEPEASTSEVFLTLFRRLPEMMHGAGGLRTFVYSVAHARLVDDYRARQRTPQAVPYDPDLDQRRSPSAEEIALSRSSDRRVSEALSTLPDDQAEVIVLRILGDLSLAQTAVIMQRSEGAIKQLQRRALLTLRAELEGKQVTK